MEAIVFNEIGKFEYTQRPEPVICNADDVKIKILAASICGSDVHILADPPGIAANTGIILGHECVGEVVDMGEEVTGFSAGDHVILDNNLTCGICPFCRSGHSNMCINMRSMGSGIDGVFCEYAVVPEYAVAKIPKETDVRKAVFAEPMNCVMSAVKKLDVVLGCTAVVLGGGPIGLIFSEFLKKNGAGKVIISEVSESRSSYAGANGADRVINPVKEDLQKEIWKETDGLGADIVIDAVGCLMRDAVSIIRPAGTILLFGLNANAHDDIVQNEITIKDVTILGNYIAVNALEDVANTLKNDLMDFTNMITHELPLKDFGVGLEAIRKGEAMEVVLYPGRK